MRFTTKNLEETKLVANHFITTISSTEGAATVVGLYGDLGAGKTSFVQGIAEVLGIEDSVVSPTFVIEKIYELGEQKVYEVKKFDHLIHIDAYRLEKSDELLHLGWKEIISDPKNLILIEWPERVGDIMPEHIKITFKHISENSREIEIPTDESKTVKIDF